MEKHATDRGPTTREPFICAELSEIAAGRFSRDEAREQRAVGGRVDRLPEADREHHEHDAGARRIAPAVIAASPSEKASCSSDTMMSKARRSTRSEIHPPMIERNSDGASWQATMMPTNVALFVSENA